MDQVFPSLADAIEPHRTFHDRKSLTAHFNKHSMPFVISHVNKFHLTPNKKNLKSQGTVDERLPSFAVRQGSTNSLQDLIQIN